jgi:threonine dehydratase
VAEILGPVYDMTHFEYSEKSSKENTTVIVGIQLKSPKDLEPLISRIKGKNFFGEYLNDKSDLFQYLI